MSKTGAVAGGAMVVVTSLVGSVLGAPPASALQPSHSFDQAKMNQLIDNFTVGEVTGQQRFVVTLGTLGRLREYMTDLDGADFRYVDSLLVGRIRDGACRDLFSAGPGTWNGELSADRATHTVILNMQVNVNGRRYWGVGKRPCVRRVVTWEMPEESAFLGVGDNHSHPTSARSDYKITPNDIPRRQLSAAPPLDGDADVDPVTPEPTVDSGPPNIDPAALDAPQIVLPDFLSDDDGEAAVDTLLGGVPENADVDTAAVRRGVADVRTQFQALATLLGGNQGPSQNQGSGDPNVQRDALISAATNPQAIAAAIAAARSALATVRDAVSGASDPAAAQIADQLGAYDQQLVNFAQAAPVALAGGIVQASTLAASAGFDPTRSPVAGLAGAGSVPGITMRLQGPPAVKVGKGASVRVTATPRNAQGVVRFVLVRNTSGGLRVVAATQATLRAGRASTRLTVSNKANRGSYTLMASLVPSARTGAGITVQRPMRVR